VPHSKQVYQRRELLLNEPTNVVLGVERSNVVSGGTSNAIIASTGSTIRDYPYAYTGAYALNSTILGSKDCFIWGAEGSAVLGATSSSIQAPDMTNQQSYSVILGGFSNIIWTEQLGYNAILGGWGNRMSGVTSNSTLVGGVVNAIRGDSNTSIILGGSSHLIDLASDSSIIAGGSEHDIATGWRSAIIGGANNRIANSNWSTMVGGILNTIDGFDNVTMINCIAKTATQAGSTYVNNLVLADYVPTSATGLQVGHVWRNGTVLNVVV